MGIMLSILGIIVNTVLLVKLIVDYRWICRQQIEAQKRYDDFVQALNSYIADKEKEIENLKRKIRTNERTT